eukprot:scaffold46957_cov39-Prasinocladus_malaysianus.AAC.1
MKSATAGRTTLVTRRQFVLAVAVLLLASCYTAVTGSVTREARDAGTALLRLLAKLDTKGAAGTRRLQADDKSPIVNTFTLADVTLGTDAIQAFSSDGFGAIDVSWLQDST